MPIVSIGSGSVHPVHVGLGSNQLQIRRIVSSAKVMRLSEAVKVRPGLLRVQGRNLWGYFGLNVEPAQAQTSSRGEGHALVSRQILNRYIPDPGFYEKAWCTIVPAIVEGFKGVKSFFLSAAEDNMVSRRIACQLVAKRELMQKPSMEVVLSILKKQGWEKLVQERALINESQLKEFYASLEVEKTETGFMAKFKIGDNIHVFTNLDVARLMIVPCGGYEMYIPEAHEMPKNENNISKLLHHIVTKSLLPRDENMGVNMIMDMVMIDCLMQEDKVDLPALMMQHMKHCKMVKEKALPYPTLVKKLLVDAGVYKEENEEVYEIKFDESWLNVIGLTNV